MHNCNVHKISKFTGRGEGDYKITDKILVFKMIYRFLRLVFSISHFLLTHEKGGLSRPFLQEICVWSFLRGYFDHSVFIFYLLFWHVADPSRVIICELNSFFSFLTDLVIILRVAAWTYVLWNYQLYLKKKSARVQSHKTLAVLHYEWNIVNRMNVVRVCINFDSAMLKPICGDT